MTKMMQRPWCHLLLRKQQNLKQTLMHRPSSLLESWKRKNVVVRKVSIERCFLKWYLGTCPGHQSCLNPTEIYIYRKAPQGRSSECHQIWLRWYRWWWAGKEEEEEEKEAQARRTGKGKGTCHWVSSFVWCDTCHAIGNVWQRKSWRPAIVLV